MAIIDTILGTPVDIAGLKAENAPKERILDGAFANFLFYASKHWSYTAGGSTGGEALLAGSAVSAPCGGIATALKRVFIDGLDVKEAEIEYIRVTGYVWTGPTFSCFDPKVGGNLRTLSGRDYRNGCIFNEHYYLKCNEKFYDPCMSTTYSVKDQCIKQTFSGTQILLVGLNRKMLVTKDKRTCILYMPNERVAGFTGAWCMFDATRKNIEKALGKKDFKSELAVRSGTTGFAKFVKTLA